MDRSDDVSAVIFTGRTIAEADVVKGLLLANGIPAVIQDEGPVAMLDGMISGNKGVDVRVPIAAVGEARAILAEAREVGDAEAPEEESEA